MKLIFNSKFHIILFIFSSCVGHSPFLNTLAKNQPKPNINHILKNEPNFTKLREMNDDSKLLEFISRLLNKKPEQRLGKIDFIFMFYQSNFMTHISFFSGAGRNGYERVKSHEFYRYIQNHKFFFNEKNESIVYKN